MQADSLVGNTYFQCPMSNEVWPASICVSFNIILLQLSCLHLDILLLEKMF